MNLSLFPILFIVLFTSLACNTKQDNVTMEVDLVDSLLVDSNVLLNALKQDTTKKAHEIKEFHENLKVIEKKYGEQWGFCECVVVNDSINKAVQNIVDYETPQAELLLERFEYVSTKCQAFLGMDANRTPEQRAAHQKKVKNCLKNAKSR